MLRIVKDGQIVGHVAEGQSFRLPTGDYVSPAYVGWGLGGFSLEAEPEPPPAPRDYAAAIKALRDAALAAGVTIGGVTVATDDLSQQRITGATVAAMLDPTLVINWKTAAGQFVPLDAPTVIAIGQAVRAHVQACFDREAALLADVASVSIPEALDLAAGWPGAGQ